jgi:hypothetical protein
MALQLHQRFLIASVSLIPAAIGTSVVVMNLAWDHTNQAGMNLIVFGCCFLALIGLLGILMCAIFWKWPDA